MTHIHTGWQNNIANFNPKIGGIETDTEDLKNSLKYHVIMCDYILAILVVE